MTEVDTLDGPLALTASECLLYEVEDALSFWFAYGRHPYRSLGGHKSFLITTSDFRYVNGPRYWRFTLEQTLGMLRELWPLEATEVMTRLEHYER